MVKKGQFVQLFLIIFFITICSHTARASVNVSIGANTWYSEWKPIWINGKRRLPPYFPALGSLPASINFSINRFKFQDDMKFLYGPLLSIKFLEKWSISSVFMIGRFRANSKGPFVNELSYPPTGVSFIGSNYRREIIKFDSDSTVNYNFHKYIKMFLGFKYQGYSFKESIYYLQATLPLSGYIADATSKNVNFGPGLGIGLTIPVYSGFFIIYNLSGSILFSRATYKIKRHILFSVPNIQPVGEFDPEKYYAYAGNTSLSFAYYIDTANITLTCGFRYQVLFFQHESRLRGFLDLNGKYEHFYGGTFSIVYSFKLGRKESKTI